VRECAGVSESAAAATAAAAATTAATAAAIAAAIAAATTGAQTEQFHSGDSHLAGHEWARLWRRSDVAAAIHILLQTVELTDGDSLILARGVLI